MIYSPPLMKTNTPPSSKHFDWLILIKRVVTKNNLPKIQEDNRCLMHGEHGKTTIFFLCVK